MPSLACQGSEWAVVAGPPRVCLDDRTSEGGLAVESFNDLWRSVLLISAVAASFVVYTLIIASVGFVSTRYSKATTADFLVADRGLGAWVAGLSAAASAESGWVTLGLVGFAFQTGIAAFWVVPGTVAAFLFNWFVLAPRLRRHAAQHNCLTLPDVLASTFDGRIAKAIRSVAAVIILVMLVAYAAAQFNAAGKMFSASFGWSYVSSVFVGVAFVFVYTLVGGFRAVAWTDVLQSIVMLATVVIVPLMLVHLHGGWSDCWEQLSVEDNKLTHPTAGKGGAALIGFFALWFGIPLGNPGQPHVLLRMMAAKDDKAIYRAGVISSLWVTVVFSGAVLLGIMARIHFGALEDPENALPHLARDGSLFPGFVGGLILAGIFAAICSTADSQLLVAASAVSHDVCEKLCGWKLQPRRSVMLDRASVVCVTAIAALIALQEVRSVFRFVLDYGWAGLGAGFGPALIMCLLRTKTSARAILAGMIVGVAIAVVWRAGFPEWNQQVYCLVPAFFGSLLTIISVDRLPRPLS